MSFFLFYIYRDIHHGFSNNAAVSSLDHLNDFSDDGSYLQRHLRRAKPDESLNIDYVYESNDSAASPKRKEFGYLKNYYQLYLK